MVDTALQEENLGALEENELQEALGSQDPLQRLLIIQSQQLNVPTKHVAMKAQTDPIQKLF